MLCFAFIATDQITQAATAQISAKITVQTDKDHYEFDNPVAITISGNVSDDVLRNEEQVIIQVFNPNGVLYRIDLANVTASSGSYNYELKLGGRMAVAGEYRVVATYRGQYQAETKFSFEGFTIRDHLCAITLCTYDVRIANVTYTISYRASGSITNVTADADRKSLILEVTTPERSSGLQMALPRALIQATDMDTGNDTQFMVLIDGVEAVYDDIPSQAREYNQYLGITENPEDYRIVSMSFGRDNKQIELVGTWVAPEFSSMLAVIIAISVAVVIVWLRIGSGLNKFV